MQLPVCQAVQPASPSPPSLPLPLCAALLHNTIALIGNNWGAEQQREPRARAHPAPLEKSFPNACHILNYIEICAHNEEDEDSHRGQFAAHSNLLAFSAILSLSPFLTLFPSLSLLPCALIFCYFDIFIWFAVWFNLFTKLDLPKIFSIVSSDGVAQVDVKGTYSI